MSDFDSIHNAIQEELGKPEYTAWVLVHADTYESVFNNGAIMKPGTELTTPFQAFLYDRQLDAALDNYYRGKDIKVVAINYAPNDVAEQEHDTIHGAKVGLLNRGVVEGDV